MSLEKESQSRQSFGFDDDSKHFPIKLVIYDFDQTITSEHLYYELDGGNEDELKKMTDDKLLRVFGGIHRMRRLTQHFERISASCELAILSFGWVQVIRNALKRMELLKYFTNSVIIGKDSNELKTAGSKAKCIYRMKKERNLKSDQVMFVDDDNGNISKAMSYSQTVLITPRNGMNINQMKQIEEKCGVYPSEPISLELTTPKTVKKEISKHYPSQIEEKEKKSNNLDKYKIKSVPKWFDNLSNPETDTPVIQIGGDQTPNSESGEYELNVPMLTNELSDIANKKPKNGLSLNFGSDTDNDNDNDNNNQ